MSVLVATAYMEEAERFDWLVAMNAGEVLATGSAEELRQQTQSATLEEAFINLLPQAQRQAHQAVVIPPYQPENAEIAIEARDLTMRFGSFVAVDHVNFRIPRGEIFGFLGSNGCGKSTTMKMLTGLLPASEGEAWLFGQPVDPKISIPAVGWAICRRRFRSITNSPCGKTRSYMPVCFTSRKRKFPREWLK